MTWLFAVIVAVMVGGLVLWLPLRKEKTNRGSLGQSLMTGAVISLAFFFLQNENQKNQKKVADRQSLRLTIGLQQHLSGADLSNNDLSGFDLVKKDLSGADLHDATLTRATLRSAALDHSSLDNAKLDGADLTDASLREALLNGVDLRKATLTRAHLEDAAIGKGAHGEEANLAGAWLVDAHLHGACLASADLRGAVLGGADLTDAVLTGADLRGAILERDGIRVNLAGAWLARAKVDPANRRFVRGSATTRAPHRSETLSSPAPAIAIHDRITRVSDGDTLELGKLGWVRLIGLNAPDLADAVGAQARDFLQEQMRRQPAIRYMLGRVPREIRPGNRGRWRAYIWLADGRLLNEAILEGGYAERQTDRPEDPAYVSLLNDAQERAKADGRRLWATCRKE